MKQLKEFEKMKNGIRNVLASSKESERDNMYKMFIAQQPRLEDKMENRIMLEQVINQYLDLKYDLRPQLKVLLENGDMAEYRRTYSIILKMEDCIGRTLGRMGLSLSPQKYIPTEERKTFDPKAVTALQEKVGKLAESVKKKKAEEKPIEAKQE